MALIFISQSAGFASASCLSNGNHSNSEVMMHMSASMPMDHNQQHQMSSVEHPDSNVHDCCPETADSCTCAQGTCHNIGMLAALSVANPILLSEPVLSLGFSVLETPPSSQIKPPKVN